MSHAKLEEMALIDKELVCTMNDKIVIPTKVILDLARELTPELKASSKYEKVIKDVCVYYGVDTKDLLSMVRTGQLVKPRKVIAYLLKTKFGLPHMQIGNLINRDRKSVEKYYTDVKNHWEHYQPDVEHLYKGIDHD